MLAPARADYSSAHLLTAATGPAHANTLAQAGLQINLDSIHRALAGVRQLTAQTLDPACAQGAAVT